jgi:hypothetical protein
MIVKFSVLVSGIAHAMSRPGCSGQQRRCCSSMQVVNNIVMLSSQFAGNLQTSCDTSALEPDYPID